MLGKDSDHFAILINLQISSALKKHTGQGVQQRIDRTRLRDKQVAQEFREHVVLEMSKESGEASDMSRLQEALRSAAKAKLTISGRRNQSWYEAAKHQIEPTIVARNAAQLGYNQHSTTHTKDRLRDARREVKRAVKQATRSWLALQISHIHKMHLTPANAWAAVKSLRNGKSITKKLV